MNLRPDQAKSDKSGLSIDESVIHNDNGCFKIKTGNRPEIHTVFFSVESGLLSIPLEFHQRRSAN